MSLLSKFRPAPSPPMDLDPEKTGRTWLITGATNGIGRELARMVAAPGRRMILPARSLERAEELASELRESGAEVDIVKLNLAHLSSVHEAAAAVRALGTDIDVMVNNAGAVTGRRVLTDDGFERILATNFLAPFAFTNLLADLVTGRIVITGSHSHKKGHVDIGDPHFEHRKWSFPVAYSQSKLADQMWATALQKRLDDAGRGVSVLTAHPGWAHTNIQNASGVPPVDTALDFVSAQFAGTSREGAMPLLEASAGYYPALTYLGPDGWLDMWGAPGVHEASALSLSEKATDRVWELGVRETGTDLPF
ncbi:SDR family NAD(P)-dependent oxidoreductase [Dietzia timorensis]|uniref:Retinol dehydrogenase 13 n=1 Tax=Dietzia timorensis TaxID=499555 RepID=A0A173LNJ7_9ACTN|nr:SDR family NAD(P)-dependent oxidoreductase [Dietzia timorensis]ANI92827.1 Retinol dehydrogenase 13 [Dietzia timorensis]